MESWKLRKRRVIIKQYKIIQNNVKTYEIIQNNIK